MSFREFREFISTFCPGLTEPQVMALMRTITADHLAKGDASGRVHVAAFLARYVSGSIDGRVYVGAVWLSICLSVWESSRQTDEKMSVLLCAGLR